MLTMAELEAEFWGLEREQPTRTRLQRVIARLHRAMIETDGGDHPWIDEFFFPLENESPEPVDAIGLIHKLQTEIGELRTELSRLKTAQAIAAQGLTVVPTCEWVFDRQMVQPWRSGCRSLYHPTKPNGVCPDCKRKLVVTDVI